VATGVGRWLTAGATSVDLAPGEARTVPLTLTVPDDAAPGELWGGVVVSRTRDVDGTATERRVALRVHVRVSGAVTPALAVEDVRVGYSGGLRASGAATVTFTVRNTGPVALAAEPSAVVSGPFGTFRSAAATADVTPRLLPGEAWPVTVDVPGATAAGLLTATASVVPLLTDAAGSTAGLAPVEAAARAWAVPWVPLLAVLLVLGFVGVLFAPRRQRPTPATPVS